MTKNGAAPKIVPVILSGGSGTRLWPMSREAYPKQLLPLASRLSLLQDTARRVGDRELFAAPLVLCNGDHRFVITDQLHEIGLAPSRVVLEPVGRNTAPAVAAAALMLAKESPDALMLVLPSDHVIADAARFRAAVRTAALAALAGRLVTFGIRPSHPETGYGYIRRGKPLERAEGCYEVAAFVEKPDRATAQSYVEKGGYDWNSGMFLFGAKRYLEEIERFEPDLLAGCRAAVDKAQRDFDYVRLDAQPFSRLKPISIDYAVMERTHLAAVVPADIGWNDVGSWSSLWDTGAKDAAGNVIVGDVVAVDARDSLLRSEGRLLAAVGVKDLIVVATDDAVLVLPKDRAQDVKTVVDALKAKKRSEATVHPRVYRPWGFYQTIHNGDRFQVKRITVNVGATLSLQMHHHRAEHWIVVNGAAEVTRGNEKFLLHENQSTYISPATVHRLANPGKVPLNLIEVQSGSYLGEDDIVRFEDSYGRAAAG